MFLKDCSRECRGVIAGLLAMMTAAGFSACTGVAEYEDRVYVLANSARSEELSSRHIGHRVIEKTFLQAVPLSQDAAHVRQILIMHDSSVGHPESLARSHAEAFALAAKVRDQIAAGGDFAELARTYSDCPTGRYKGGDIGLIRKGETASAFEEAVFSLHEKNLSAIVETSYGFHIIERIPQV